MTYTFYKGAWILKTTEGKEVARFKTRRDLLKFMHENPNAGTQETVSKEEEPSAEEEVFDEEEEILDEEEEDS